jgi:hypothetical protein
MNLFFNPQLELTNKFIIYFIDFPQNFMVNSVESLIKWQKNLLEFSKICLLGKQSCFLERKIWMTKISFVGSIKPRKKLFNTWCLNIKMFFILLWNLKKKVITKKLFIIQQTLCHFWFFFRIWIFDNFFKI